MTGIIPADEIKRLQKRMNRLIEDLGLTELESRYLEEMQRIQKRMSELMEETDVTKLERNIILPLADVGETDEAIIVIMDLPGVDKHDVDIIITDDELHVTAEKKIKTELAEKNYLKRERTQTKFERKVKLPKAVKAEEAKAKLSDGVLELTLPKEMITAKRRINIE
jgi:HSP20 family protein